MPIAEPMTMFTDYVLAGVTGWLGWLMFRARERQAARASWALAFASLAVAAVLGGTHHGFAPQLSDIILHLLWKATLLAVGIASFSMLVGSTIAATTGTVQKHLLALAVVKLALYSGWMVTHDEFVYVIADTGIAMAAIGVLHGWLAMRIKDRASLWMLCGVGVSVLAAGVQASGFALHRHFNHNDLYHLVQIVAMGLFYLGGAGLRDRAKN